MKKLAIDLDELTIAFENSGWEMNHYLDLETGQVIVVDAEVQGQLDKLYAELDDAGEELPDNLAEILRERGLPEWEQEAMLAADEIERGYGSRYVGIPQDDSHTAYGDMEDFIAGTTWDGPVRGGSADRAFACAVMRCTAGGDPTCTMTGKRFAWTRRSSPHRPLSCGQRSLPGCRSPRTSDKN